MIVNDHYLKKNNNNLAGYSKNRTKLHRIMFTKAVNIILFRRYSILIQLF
jgi:hypothetical protein